MGSQTFRPRNTQTHTRPKTYLTPERHHYAGFTENGQMMFQEKADYTFLCLMIKEGQ